MNTPFYGLIGQHLGHSYSSMIHRELGCGDYIHVELEPEEIKGFMERKIGGLNITIPYKKDVSSFCDILTPEAKEIGAVNTVYEECGKRIGHNTDADGFLFMAKNAGVELKGKKIVILGSGGASLAVSYAVKKAGARCIVTVSRKGEDNYENISRHFDADVIVNATPVGMFPEGEGKPLSLGGFKNLSGVLDLIYNPFRTNLLIEAEERSIPSANGLSMLVAQAKSAEERFKCRSIDDGEVVKIVKLIARNTRNIALVGMPGSGKSTVGKVLSRLSGKEVIDLDDEIVKREKVSIPEIFERGGEPLFRKIESEVLQTFANTTGKIIVTGGGAVKTEENYLPLKRTSRIYHLEREVSSLSRDGRPLSKGADLQKMYEERLPLYERFRDAVVTVDENAEKTAESIWRDYCENSCN